MFKILKSKRKGFSGVTHVLIAIALFFTMLLFPVKFFSEFILMAGSMKYFLVFLVVLSGASLLPDLDNSESTAGYQLGLLGSLIKTFMATTAYVIYNMYNLKNDRPPPSMHRLFWHTPFIGIIILFYFIFFLPSGDSSYWSLLREAINSKSVGIFLFENTAVTITIVLSFACGMLGSNIILYWPFKILPIGYKTKSIVNSIIPVLIILFLINVPISDLKFVGVAIGLGYIFHIVGDAISQGSVPLHWPIPWKGKAWNRPNLLGPFQIKTGGIINTVLNFVLLAVNIFLIIKIF